MNRRDILTGLGAAASTALAACAVRAQGAVPHQHGGAAAGTPRSPALAKILESTARCRTAGEVCLAHCTDNLAAGDTAMAACQRAVMNMLASVEAMHKVAAYHSASEASIAALARACAEFCKACAEACAPHRDHHAACRECGDACAACAEACSTLAG